MQILDGIIALLLMVGIFASIQPGIQPNLSELHILQKENDLLKAWLQDDHLTEEAIILDFHKMFPKINGEIEFKGNLIQFSEKNTKKTKTSTIIQSQAVIITEGELEKIIVRVFVA